MPGTRADTGNVTTAEIRPGAAGVERLAFLPNLFWATTEDEALRNIVAGDETGPVYGQFSLVREEGSDRRLVRDRLGLNKLFYHIDPDAGTLTAGHYLYDVARATGDYNRVFSVPAGHCLLVDGRTRERRLVSYWDLRQVSPRSERDFKIGPFQELVDEFLSGVFSELRRGHPGRRFFICLSGGLDSAIVAAYARRYLDDVTAVSFSYDDRPSADFRAAEAIAGRLGLPFMPVIARKRLDPGRLDEVLRYGQDWRDFNVHCAWVNHHLAEHIAKEVRAGEATVLTGDLMNEWVADYAPAEYRGTTYYPQPRIPRDKLRRFLVYGLDAGDRELGIFHRHGLTVVQPYSILAEAYLSVPAEVLARDDSKEQLNRALLSRAGAADVGACVATAKVRAQVGSATGGGTLGLFHDSGITQGALEECWRKLFAPTAREGRLEPMIVGGRYRFEDLRNFPWEVSCAG